MKLKQCEKSELTREKILAAAVDEFAEKGFWGARVDTIAVTSGINKRMIYAHFENKENLYSQVLLIAYEWVAECERRFMIEEADPITSIRNIIFGEFEFLHENGRFVRVLMWESLNRAICVPRDELIKLKAPTFEYIKRQIIRGKEMGIFSPSVDEEHTVLSLMSFGFSYFSNAHTLSALLGKDITSRDNVISRSEFIFDMIIKYLQS